MIIKKLKRSNESALVYTVPKAALLLDVATSTVYDAIARGELPCIKIGKRRLIPRLALDQLLNQPLESK